MDEEGEKIWKLMKRFSMGGLRDRYIERRRISRFPPYLLSR